MSRLGPRLFGLVLTCWLPVAAFAQPKSPGQAPPPADKEAPSVTCVFVEVAATSAKEPSMDPELEDLKKKLSKPPFTSWNVFKLQHKEQRVLAVKKAETIKLKLGSLDAKFLGTANTNEVRLSISFDVNNKNIVNTTAVIKKSQYFVHGHSLPDNSGHLVALTCK